VMLTDGMTAPVSSDTVPLSVADADCACMTSEFKPAEAAASRTVVLHMILNRRRLKEFRS